MIDLMEVSASYHGVKLHDYVTWTDWCSEGFCSPTI